MAQRDTTRRAVPVPTNIPSGTSVPGGLGTLVQLRDGADVLLRAARPEDEAGLLEMFYHLSDETRSSYFFLGVPATPSWAQRFAALGAADGLTACALLAQVEEHIVGLARFDRLGDTTVAEIGILLVDSWQSRGLGQQMIARLSGEARERGITSLMGRVLWGNRRALGMARRVLPGVSITCAAGEWELRVGIDQPPDKTDTEGGSEQRLG